jgi:hypothetical protein
MQRRRLFWHKKEPEASHHYLRLRVAESRAVNEAPAPGSQVARDERNSVASG